MRGIMQAAIALFVLAVSSDASAFELLRVNNDGCARGDQNLFWADALAKVSTASLPDSLRALGDEARSRWNASLRRFNFQPQTTGIGQSVCERDGVTTMVVASTTCDGSSFGDALAVTRSVWRSDGSLVDADVVFNRNSRIIGDNDAFLEVAMHELGHVLGLDHSDACDASGVGTLMRSILVFGAPRLEAPQADDVAGGESIYSPASRCCVVCTGGKPCGDSCIEATDTCHEGEGCACDAGADGQVPEGANSCAVVRPTGGTAAPLLWVGALALLGIWRRTRIRD